jgi:hypothetical protein
MNEFYPFLRLRLESGGFSTEDVLSSFLPLARETLEAHAAGLVGPFDGLRGLKVDETRVWFGISDAHPLRSNFPAITRILQPQSAGLEIQSEIERTTNVDRGTAQVKNLQIGEPGNPIERPVFLPNYNNWEHELDHQDPTTDMFSLGMILASMACNLDFTEPKDLDRLVEHRHNLFQINPDLHPVLARAIVRMTELDRHKRAQDLGTLLQSLGNYRDQVVDLEIDLAQIQGFDSKDLETKQQLVLAKLRDRLFEISRRNRLLDFRPTLQTVNLTYASIPLAFDVRSIRSEVLLTWNNKLHDLVCSDNPSPLNNYLNFREAIYLPSVLRRIIAESRRDLAEFGFHQLRLAACFLKWANIKEEPHEVYDSPLVLLPVKLVRTAGVTDQYYLEVLDTEAEINPVVRHLFKQLYGIELPETLNLHETDLEKFYEYLRTQIEMSNSGVTLKRIDKPQIELIHEKAKRQVEQYRRRARISGRGVRRYLNLDYSYNAANYHPMGLKMFDAKIRPPVTRLEDIVETDGQLKRRFMVAEDQPKEVTTRQRILYRAQPDTANPYSWTFDLCRVSLANFRYRRMSLVRDFEELLERQESNQAFESTFSFAPRPIAEELITPELQDRFDVVPCDPTQASAIGQARSGPSYIIQGPPGTGKSQTITNLIADYVARGKRVLFVCEKRAAIDVVFARLKQVGLGELCCLVHDSQSDKKQFVMNLKSTYESFLESDLGESGPGTTTHQPGRDNLFKRFQNEIEPLKNFQETMKAELPTIGMPTRRFLNRLAELRPLSPEVDPLTEEWLPNYKQWLDHSELLNRFQLQLCDIQPNGILAENPLRFLDANLTKTPQPLQRVISTVDSAQRGCDRILQLVAATEIPELTDANWEQLFAAALYGRSMSHLSHATQFQLLDQNSKAADLLATHKSKFEKRQADVAKAKTKTEYWRNKLPQRELETLLRRVSTWEQSNWYWLSSSWWKTRSLLKKSYNFEKHQVKPTWSQILEELDAEYNAEKQVLEAERELCDAFHFSGNYEQLVEQTETLLPYIDELGPLSRQIHQRLLQADEPIPVIEKLAGVADELEALLQQLNGVLDGYETLTIEQLVETLGDIHRNQDRVVDFVHCLASLSEVPAVLRNALRRFPWRVEQLEAACAEKSLNQISREDRAFAKFTAVTLERHVDQIADLYSAWMKSNAAEIKRRVAERFLNHVQISNQANGELDADQKEFKKIFNRGRKELEHEFGKQMRYKAIRDLVANESGIVVKDLKPIWLMSPLSVSDTLPLDTTHVDVVIFDEASQITLEESIPSLFRAEQAIVVGDEMQLPPTDFFSAKRQTEEDELAVNHEGETITYDLESNSFLNHASKNLPSTLLGWHYRSRSEILISFSNWAFYQGRLLTVPDESLPFQQLSPLLSESPLDGRAHAKDVLQRAVSFHFMQHGLYEKRRNRGEADYIANLVREHLLEGDGKSVGIIAFSEAQQTEIENALERLSEADPEFRSKLEAEYEREEDGQFQGLLVKNLENIQGDERDIIILSVCYGYNKDRKMLMNFGPINKSGGEKRLNVAFTRAKHHMVLVSSIHSVDITNDYNDGASCLKAYLRYAEVASIGDHESVAVVLQQLAKTRGGAKNLATPVHDTIANQLAEALEQEGVVVDRNVGQSHFRCNLAIRRSNQPNYSLGILLDNEDDYHSDTLEREVMRPRLLAAFGWKILRVIGKDWIHDREQVLANIRQQIEVEEEKEIDEDEDGWELEEKNNT